jgi:hypothetical protein
MCKKRLTRKLEWMKGVKMTEIFRSTRKCRTFEAFLQSRLRPLARQKHPAGSTAQRAANEDDPRLHPPAGHLWRPLPPVVACGPEFSPDRYTYDGGWDIYAAGPSGLAASARETARGQSRLRHGKVIFVTSTLRR